MMMTTICARRFQPFPSRVGNSVMKSFHGKRTTTRSSATTTTTIPNAAVRSPIENLIRKDGFPFINVTEQNAYAPLGKWILGTAGLVIGMIHIGGITRLTQSGLSMTDWKLTGSLPPLSRSEWEIEFERYKQYPEWQQRKSMTLSDFQSIYFWEYGHRMFGRFIGIAFLGPYMYFTIRKRIPIHYHPRFIGLGFMGFTQGLVGWWMVKSGLTDDRRNDKKEIRVKPIRLTAHLSMAVATYVGLLYTGLDLLKYPHPMKPNSQWNEFVKAMQDGKIQRTVIDNTKRIRYGAIGVTSLTALTIISGALVAGNDAGRAYSTFPKMNDDWIPPTEVLLELQPPHRNFIENTALVQLNHRILGTTTALSGLGLAFSSFYLASSSKPSHAVLLTPQVRKGFIALGLAVTGQFTLGVTTLLWYVPISLAALHQMGSIVVLTSGVYLIHSLKYIVAKPMITNKVTTTASTSSIRTSVANTLQSVRGSFRS